MLKHIQLYGLSWLWPLFRFFRLDGTCTFRRYVFILLNFVLVIALRRKWRVYYQKIGRNTPLLWKPNQTLILSIFQIMEFFFLMVDYIYSFNDFHKWEKGSDSVCFFLYGLFIVIVRWMNSVSKDGEELLDLDSYVKVVCSSYVVM